MRHWLEHLKCGRGFKTSSSYLDASHDILIGVIVLQYVVRVGSFRLMICCCNRCLASSNFSQIPAVTHILSFFFIFLLVASAICIPCFSSSLSFSLVLPSFPWRHYGLETKERVVVMCTGVTNPMIVATHRPSLSWSSFGDTTTGSMVILFLWWLFQVTYAKFSFSALCKFVTPPWHLD